MSKPHLKLGFDIDGVLGEFNLPLAARMGRTVAPDWVPSCWDYPQHEWGMSEEEVKAMWLGIMADENFWYNEPALLGAKDLQYALDRNGDDGYTFDPIYITSRPGNTAFSQTYDWLDYHGLLPGTVIVSSKKGDLVKTLNIDYYVDDKLENCLDVFEKTGRKPYLLDYPYNRHCTPDEALKVHRISSVQEMFDDVERYTRIK
jgi:uncharacterized HAD superfamily protein